MQIVSEWWGISFFPIGVGIFLVYLLYVDFRTWTEAPNMRKDMSNWKSLSLFFGDTLFYLMVYLIAMFFAVQMLIDEGVIILT